MAEISIERIAKVFGDVSVLKGVSLAIADGEFVSLVGPSGCGKSTLLRIVAGLESQTSGQIGIDGEPVDHLRPSERNLAMVFQSYALYPHLTVFDNIAVPLRMRRLTAMQRLPGARYVFANVRRIERFIREDVAEVATLLDMQGLLGRKPAQLSGGQRQRVAVGRAIVREPSAFLFDEPLSNLDAKLRVHMRTELALLHQRLGATFLYVTHDQAEAMTMSDRIAVMFDGELVQVGTPDEVYDNPLDLRVAELIGSPKINLLPGRVEAGAVACLGARIPIHVEAPVGTPINVGVRPEAIRFDRRSPSVIVGKIARTENLGSEMLVHVVVDGQDSAIVVRLDRDMARKVRAVENVTLSFAPEDVRLFGVEGHRIGHSITAAVPALHVFHPPLRTMHG